MPPPKEEFCVTHQFRYGYPPAHNGGKKPVDSGKKSHIPKSGHPRGFIDWNPKENEKYNWGVSQEKTMTINFLNIKGSDVKKEMRNIYNLYLQRMSCASEDHKLILQKSFQLLAESSHDRRRVFQKEMRSLSARIITNPNLVSENHIRYLIRIARECGLLQALKEVRCVYYSHSSIHICLEMPTTGIPIRYSFLLQEGWPISPPEILHNNEKIVTTLPGFVFQRKIKSIIEPMEKDWKPINTCAEMLRYLIEKGLFEGIFEDDSHRRSESP